MVRRIIGMFAWLTWAAASAAPLAAQAGTIRGTISDSAGAGLANAAISVEGTGLRTTTGAAGAYEVRGVPPGSHTVRVRLIGFEAATAQASIAAGDATQLDLTLTRSAVQLAPIDVVVGSRARHTAEEELAVPVDIFPAEELQQQGSTETSVILQSVSPSVNFPRQSVVDAGEIVRPFTLRGLSPDHTLVLLNGWRRHQTAVLNTFNYGMPAGSSGVDLNTLPASALDRIEVLRDGASAQYGSDAIAGVVNLVLKDGAFSPFVNGDIGRYTTDDYPDDGTTANANGGWGIGIGRGSLGLFGEFRDREPTNRAWADLSETAGTGVPDSIDTSNGQVIEKRNPVPQPNHHWGDGLEKDVLTFANFRMPLNDEGTTEVYSFGGYGHRDGTGNAFRRYASNARNWPQIYPLGFLPTFSGTATDYSGAAGVRGVASGWNYDLGAELGQSGFDYNMTTTLNPSLGPCLDVPCAPGPDRVLGTPDDPGIPNQTEFFAGRLLRREFVAAVNVARPVEIGLPAPVNLAFGVAFRRESFKTREGELASYIDGDHLAQDSTVAVPGSSGFAGFTPENATERDRNNFGFYADAESDLTPTLLANVAARFESYNDFGERLSGKMALRYQPSRRVVFRAAAGTGFRAPGLSQVAFNKVITNVIADQFVEVGIFPVDHPAALALGSRPLTEETSLNLSAGLAYTPVDNITITADYFHIRINDRVLLGATFDDAVTLQLLANAGITNVDGVQYFTNGLDTRTQGVDVTGNLEVPAGASGKLDLTGSINYTRNEIINVDPLPQVLQDAGSTEPGLLDTVTVLAIEKERPDWRATLQANYTIGRVGALGRFSYYGGFSSAQPGFCDLCREDYGGKSLVDAELSYQFNLVKLALGIRNLFDTYPDSPSSLRDTGLGGTSKDFNDNFGTFPWAAASPFGYNGRFLYGRTEIQLAW